MTEAPFDPSGIDLMTRGMENAWRNRLATGSPIGPLPDPRWAGFFQALEDQGVNRLVGGPSAPGSNQIRGESVQPNYLSGGTAGEALADVARSMESQPGSINWLRARQERQQAEAAAKAATEKAATEKAAKAAAPSAPAAPPAPPPPRSLGPTVYADKDAFTNHPRPQGPLTLGSMNALRMRTMF